MSTVISLHGVRLLCGSRGVIYKQSSVPAIHFYCMSGRVTAVNVCMQRGFHKIRVSLSGMILKR